MLRTMKLLSAFLVLSGCVSGAEETAWHPTSTVSVELVDVSDDVEESVEAATSFINEIVGADVFRVVQTDGHIRFSVDRNKSLPFATVLETKTTDTGCSVLVSASGRTEAVGMALLKCLGYPNAVSDGDILVEVIDDMKARFGAE